MGESVKRQRPAASDSLRSLLSVFSLAAEAAEKKAGERNRLPSLDKYSF
jgi:hypothetical protein